MSHHGRTILTPPDGLRLGNYMYFWLHAFARQTRGEDYRVLIGSEVIEWRHVFPRVFEDLCVGEVPGDQGEPRVELISESYLQSFGRDFSRPILEAFVRDYILTSPMANTPGVSADRQALTLNVRRGDYYSETHLRECYGMDCIGYAELAVRAAHPVTDLLVVSDDIPWCRQNLSGLKSHVESLNFASDSSAARDFFLLAASRRLALANSTFSYWSAHVSNVLFENWHLTWVPDFHSRCVNQGAPWQLDPRWNRIPCR